MALTVGLEQRIVTYYYKICHLILQYNNFKKEGRALFNLLTDRIEFQQKDYLLQ